MRFGSMMPSQALNAPHVSLAQLFAGYSVGSDRGNATHHSVTDVNSGNASSANNNRGSKPYTTTDLPLEPDERRPMIEYVVVSDRYVVANKLFGPPDHPFLRLDPYRAIEVWDLHTNEHFELETGFYPPHERDRLLAIHGSTLVFVDIEFRLCVRDIPLDHKYVKRLAISHIARHVWQCRAHTLASAGWIRALAPR